MPSSATVALPPSLAGLFERFRPCFTAPTFETFCMLMAGFIACAGTRTVCGMLSGAGLARVWPHDRAHAFFARRRWNAEHLGLTLARLVADLLIGEGAPVLVAVDDTLFRRRGKKVWAASWFHDGSAPEAHATGYGNNWVICAIVVRLPFMTRPVALPVLAGLVKKGTVSASRLEVARRLVTALAEALPGRKIDVVGDAAYVGGVLKKLPETVSWTSRLRKDAALYALPPAPAPRRRGRPALKGARLPALVQLAASLSFTEVVVTRYRRTETVRAASLVCLWYGVFGTRPVQVVVIQSPSGALEVALVSTDLDATIGQVIERYAARWSIEVAILEAKQIFGVGQARNRTARAVQRTVPFGLAAQTLTICWYALHGQHDRDLAAHRSARPWYTSKTTISIADAHAALRRALIATKYRMG
ncbi:IS701 family transposase, partial [Sphaerimonospora thailandensis]